MNSRFRSKIVTARYWVNGIIILVLIALPIFKVIKFDFLNGKFYLFGGETTWLSTGTGFVGFWAGSYVLTLLADFIYGRLFCGWICSWGSLLRALSYTRESVKRKHLPSYSPQVFTAFAALLATVGLLNWFTDITVLFRPEHKAFLPYTLIFLSLVGIGTVMLWKVGLTFCQKYCPIGLYLGVISQKHMMRIDFEAANCTLGEVCVHDCPMALDPRLLAMDTEDDSHSQCILCGDCLTSCNACAAKVPGEKPLQLRTSFQPTQEIDLGSVLQEMRLQKKKKSKPKKPSTTPKEEMITN
ncbi:MAG: 4Fe-4S binding protein [Ignavibacteriota bacterium]